MIDKLDLCVIFGGKSSEYEVSCRSAFNILMGADKEKYNITTLGITKEGCWFLYNGDFSKIKDRSWSSDSEHLKKAFLSPDRESGGIIVIDDNKTAIIDVDVCFPVLHGKNGEDGTIQGLLELAGISYVAPKVTASALCMNKVYANIVFDHIGLAQPQWIYFMAHEIERDFDSAVAQIENKFGYPCVIKPANAGSSVGVSIPKNRSDLINGIQLAMLHDSFILVEEFVSAREVECAVLGNNDPKASCIGEIVSPEGFYDYEEKYEKDSSTLMIPADLPTEISEEISNAAVAAYKATDCKGMARCDFFVRKSDHKVMINELNTIPGFNDISMYPKLWEKSGLPLTSLIDELIRLAMEK